MAKVSRTLLHFFEKGYFDSKFKQKKEEIEVIEKAVYEAGLKRYIEGLTKEIKSELKYSPVLFNSTLVILTPEDGVYLSIREPDFKLYSFESNSLEDRALELKDNKDEILKRAVKIMNNELDVIAHNKKVFNEQLEKLIEEERSKGEFLSDYDFYNTTKENFSLLCSYNPMISATYSPSGSYLKALFLDMTFFVKTKYKSDCVKLEDKYYSSKEARELLEWTVQEFKSKFESKIAENVIYSIRTLLARKHDFTYNMLDKIEFINPKSDGLKLTFKNVYRNPEEYYRKKSTVSVLAPINVKSSDIEKIVRHVETVGRIGNEQELVRAVFKHINIGPVSSGSFEDNLSKGILSDDYSKENIENIISKINESTIQAFSIIESNSYPEGFESFGYGKGFFFKKNKSFEYAGSLFERIDYRMPFSKKTKSIMYENGERISANRFFRMLRKSKKNSITK